MECGTKQRMHYLDNIRSLIIILVIVVHSCVVYSGTGSWFYMDDEGTDDVTAAILSVFQIFMQAFFMGILFFVSGYFVPGSFQRKGNSRFLKDRALRLGIPTLIVMFLIAPFMLYFIWYADEESLASWYSGYLAAPLDWDTGPMWFAVALLVFCVAYVAYKRLMGPRISKTEPRELTNLYIIGIAAFMAIATFVVRIFYPIGTSVWNMQLCYFVQYATMFALGIVAYKGNWLNKITDKMGRNWLIVGFISMFTVVPAILVIGGPFDEDFFPYAGKLNWQSLMLTAWEQLYCMAMSIGLIVLFRRKLNVSGRLTGFLSSNSFAAYTFHPPVLTSIAVVLASTALIAPVKFLILVPAAVAATFLLCEFVIRRLPGLKKLF